MKNLIRKRVAISLKKKVKRKRSINKKRKKNTIAPEVRFLSLIIFSSSSRSVCLEIIVTTGLMPSSAKIKITITNQKLQRERRRNKSGKRRENTIKNAE